MNGICILGTKSFFNEKFILYKQNTRGILTAGCSAFLVTALAPLHTSQVSMSLHTRVSMAASALPILRSILLDMRATKPLKGKKDPKTDEGESHICIQQSSQLYRVDKYYYYPSKRRKKKKKKNQQQQQHKVKKGFQNGKGLRDQPALWCSKCLVDPWRFWFFRALGGRRKPTHQNFRCGIFYQNRLLLKAFSEMI